MSSCCFQLPTPISNDSENVVYPHARNSPSASPTRSNSEVSPTATKAGIEIDVEEVGEGTEIGIMDSIQLLRNSTCSSSILPPSLINSASQSPSSLPSTSPSLSCKCKPDFFQEDTLPSSDTRPSKFFCFKFSSSLATGWYMDAAARGPILMSNVFLARALLDLAKIEAGCSNTDFMCENRVHGFLPSSLLTNMVMISGVVNACLMPIVGAVVDHTHHRRTVGILSAVLLLVVNTMLVGINSKNWLYMAIIQLVGAFAYMTHVVIAFAYMVELTDDRKRLARYTASFNILQYSGCLFFLILVVSLSWAIGVTNVGTVRISQIFVVITTAILMGAAWFLHFPRREALSVVPEGSWLITTGFRKLGRTAVQISSKNYALKWMIVALLFAEAGGNSFTQIAITFTTEVLKLNQNETGLVMMILLIGTVPGSRFATAISNRFNPKFSYQCGVIYFGAVTLMASNVMKDEGDKQIIYFFCRFLGIWFWMDVTSTTHTLCQYYSKKTGK
mmetsp:Transcript_30446/g.69708  ORF Transcript_30446/g.69708 Transcript_30446/m.69708 type:complete len:503 (-) Transcript_30446:625-2133(-)